MLVPLRNVTREIDGWQTGVQFCGLRRVRRLASIELNRGAHLHHDLGEAFFEYPQQCAGTRNENECVPERSLLDQACCRVHGGLLYEFLDGACTP